MYFLNFEAVLKKFTSVGLLGLLTTKKDEDLILKLDAAVLSQYGFKINQENFLLATHQLDKLTLSVGRKLLLGDPLDVCTPSRATKNSEPGLLFRGIHAGIQDLLSLFREIEPIFHSSMTWQNGLAVLLAFREEIADKILYLAAKGDEEKFAIWKSELDELCKNDTVKLTSDLVEFSARINAPKEAQTIETLVHQTKAMIQQSKRTNEMWVRFILVVLERLPYEEIARKIPASFLQRMNEIFPMAYLPTQFLQYLNYFSLSGLWDISLKVKEGYQKGGLSTAVDKAINNTIRIIPGARVIADTLDKLEPTMHKSKAQVRTDAMSNGALSQWHLHCIKESSKIECTYQASENAQRYPGDSCGLRRRKMLKTSY